MNQEELEKIEQRAKAALHYERSICLEEEGMYEPAGVRVTEPERHVCPLCEGEGDIDAQRYDSKETKASTVVAYGIGEGLYLAEQWVENGPQDVLDLLAALAVVKQELDEAWRERGEAQVALARIALAFNCEPRDHNDLVEAARLLVDECDGAKADRDTWHATANDLGDERDRLRERELSNAQESTRCTCDDFADESCLVHARENALQNEVLALRERVRLAEAWLEADDEWRARCCCAEPPRFTLAVARKAFRESKGGE